MPKDDEPLVPPGTLVGNEPHPGYNVALKYLSSLGFVKLSLYMESFASCSLSDNRTGEVCAETLRRVLGGGEPISDRYLMGLAWMVYELENSE